MHRGCVHHDGRSASSAAFVCVCVCVCVSVLLALGRVSVVTDVALPQHTPFILLVHFLDSYMQHSRESELIMPNDINTVFLANSLHFSVRYSPIDHCFFCGICINTLFTSIRNR